MMWLTLSVSLLSACTGTSDEPDRALGSDKTNSGETGSQGSGETGSQGTGETGSQGTGETGSQGTGETGLPDALTVSVQEMGDCAAGSVYYGYATSFGASSVGDTVSVNVSAIFGGCGCGPVSITATAIEPDLVFDLDHGKCDGLSCCAYRIEADGVPPGTWTVSMPEADHVDATAEVTVSGAR